MSAFEEKHTEREEGKSIPRCKPSFSRRGKSEMHFRINLSHRCYSYKVSEKIVNFLLKEEEEGKGIQMAEIRLGITYD